MSNNRAYCSPPSYLTREYYSNRLTKENNLLHEDLVMPTKEEIEELTQDFSWLAKEEAISPDYKDCTFEDVKREPKFTLAQVNAIIKQDEERLRELFKLTKKCINNNILKKD